MAAPRTAAKLAPLLDRYGARIQAELRSALQSSDLTHYGLMRYHLGWEDRSGRPEAGFRGKLLRPLLCLVSCEAVGGNAERALPLAAALELMHNFSLIHDDIEDHSPQRHGRDTVWRVWGVAQAVNAGDGMFALAHVTLHRLQATTVAATRVLAAARLLDQASLRLCEGQYQDLAFERQTAVSSADYLDMVGGKTAALMAAAAASGALVGDAGDEVVAVFERFGENLGFAFQIRDDILGIWGQASATGKPTGEDIRARKKSFPIVYALERASSDDRAALQSIYDRNALRADDVAKVLRILERTRARASSQRAAARYATRALGHLEGLDLVPERRRDLETLAAYFVSREA